MWRTGAIAALLTVAVTAAASAQPPGECKQEVMTASGDAKFRPFTRARELACEGAAASDAIGRWQREVNAKFGEQWMRWDLAKKVDPITGKEPRESRKREGRYAPEWCRCSPARAGKIGGLSVRCTVTAIPCGGTPEKTVEEGPGGIEGPRRCEEYPISRVREVQGLLSCTSERCEKLIGRRPDGICGPNTDTCIRAFQRSRDGRRAGLEENGLPNRRTLEALRDYCGVEQAERRR
jgi:hypothetical protein